MTRTKLKSKMAAKKAALKSKMATKKAAIKAKCCAIVAAMLVIATIVNGCALERADPAARSNRAIYTITVTAHGDNSTAYTTITDGLMATADGEGAITQPSRQSAEQSPEIAVPGDAISAGIQAVGHVTGKAIDAYAASKSGESGSSSGSSTCPGGNCSDCPDGNCSVDGANVAPEL